MAQGWSSLPADLVNRVADCLLATNDLDYYVLRAVCHHWRSGTADPGSNQHDPRFRPSRWVMLDEPKNLSFIFAILGEGPFLFVNTATGRFLRMRLTILRGRFYEFVTSTPGGLIVLLDSTHAVRVLNTFTCSMICFGAQLSTGRSAFTAYVVGSTPTLVLVSTASDDVYRADPQSRSFSVETHANCPARRLPLVAAGVSRESVPGSKNILDRHCYTVEVPGGDILAVLKRRRALDVFKIDAAGNVMERVKSIGSRALFLGVRCLVVDTDCFPMVEANCAYFRLIGRLSNFKDYIYKLNIGTHDEERLDNLRPYTLTHLLCNYTMDIPGHQTTWEMRFLHLMLKAYVDFAD